EALHTTSAYISTVDFEHGVLCVAAEYWSEQALPSERKSDLGRCYSLQDYPSFAHVLITGEIMMLHRDCQECSDLERQEFVEYGVQSILFIPVLSHGKTMGGIEVWESRYRREFTQAEIFLAQSMAAHAGSILENIALYEQTRRQAEDLAQAYDNTLAGWARALELRDEQTQDHTRRVTEMALQLARALGLPEDQLVHIRRGAILHDIGKMGIPDAILHKPGPLTPEEEELMRQHPQFAYEMLYPIEFLRPALDIPYCHHERWDGTGYPRGLKGEEIPLAARIFAVVDNWDALISDRPYRPAWSKARAREYLRQQAGKMFDPKIVEVFLSLEIAKDDLSPA
ncbi:MAG: HD domain-containing protein, partial [Anaerolineales bacterium]|nr:HD domain-containing protein [Anaerolineales bacterium]